eukprot:COSAG05_NODE_1262_length_5337_cov_612.892728_1_plen_225_part_00
MFPPVAGGAPQALVSSPPRRRRRLAIQARRSWWARTRLFALRGGPARTLQSLPHQGVDNVPDGTTVDVKLATGDEQHFAYDVTRRDPRTDAVIGEQPLPPFDKPNAPRVDVVVNGKKKEGFEGKAKGIKQILFESGWYKPGMVLQMSLADLNDPQKNPKGRTKEMLMKHVLSQRPDFLEELTDLEKLLRSRGHILVMSVSTGCYHNRPLLLSCLLLHAAPYVPP